MEYFRLTEVCKVEIEKNNLTTNADGIASFD
jgi:hypothetical protein